jgi:hypothetical protein
MNPAAIQPRLFGVAWMLLRKALQSLDSLGDWTHVLIKRNFTLNAMDVDTGSLSFSAG